MRIKRILIVGSNSYSSEVGSMFLRAASFLNLETEICNTNIQKYAPSMQNIGGKVFYKLYKKRPIEWNKFNKYIASKIITFKPDLILVSGIFSLSKDVFHLISKEGIFLVNFLTDDPLSKRSKSKYFLNTLSFYDLIISTKRRIINDLYSYGARRVEFMFYAFDPFLHRLPDQELSEVTKKFECDISFTGTGHIERLPYLNYISENLSKYKLNLYGKNWERIKANRWNKKGDAQDNDLRLSFQKSKISLCLLRKTSRDDSTQRTFEIAPCGGCGIYEDTPEHREILFDYPDYGFFKSPEDLTEKCKWLLENPQEINYLRKIGREIICNDNNTFYKRLNNIMDLL